MNYTKPIGVIVLTVLAYSALFILRTEFDILTYSGLADWLFLLLIAIVPSILFRNRKPAGIIVIYLSTIVLEAAATVAIILIWYPGLL